MPIYIKFDGIDGSVTEKGFEKWCNVLSCSTGMSHTTRYDVGVGGSGGRGGKTDVQDVHVSKQQDTSSAKLWEFGLMGKHIPKVDIAFVTSGSERHKYKVIKLTDVIVSSYQESNDGEGGHTPESLSLNGAKIEFEFIEMQKDGKPAPAVRFGYDLQKATKV